MTMKKLSLPLLLILFFASCKDRKNTPDVSSIKVDLAIQRFDQDFFSMDTLGIEKGFSNLQQKYPGFLPIFLQNIVGVGSPEEVVSFYRLYKPIYDTAQLIYKNMDFVKSDLEKALRYVKHYYPSYELPNNIIPILGPMNSLADMAMMANGDYTPNFIGQGFVGISLQFYLGTQFHLYREEYFVNNVAPRYRSRRFSKEYIVPEIMKLIADDVSPDKSSTRPLMEQMIEKGKQWWLLENFMPDTPDSLYTGYTQDQLDWCNDNEGLIWSHILKNENLYANDPPTIQTYIGEGPFTQGLSQEQSPGNIGQWIGWQIVRKFVDKHSTLKMEEVMKTSPKDILEKSKYKPK